MLELLPKHSFTYLTILQKTSGKPKRPSRSDSFIQLDLSNVLFGLGVYRLKDQKSQKAHSF